MLASCPAYSVNHTAPRRAKLFRVGLIEQCSSLSLRDVETILAARGIVVSYESIRD